MENTRILVVEDDNIIANLIKTMLKRLGYNVVDTAETGEEAILKVITKIPDLVLMDVNLNGQIDGVEAATYIYHIFNIPNIFLTAHTESEVILRAKEAEPLGFIIKPFTSEELFSSIEIALSNYQKNRNPKGFSHQGLRRLMHVEEGIIILNKSGKVLFLNPYAEYLTGWTQEQAKLKSIDQLFSLTDEFSGDVHKKDWYNQFVREDYVYNSDRLVTLSSTKEKRDLKIKLLVQLVKNQKNQLFGTIFLLDDNPKYSKWDEKVRKIGLVREGES